jgi:hypothetical protein
MNLERIKAGISHIASEASFIFGINNKSKHAQALKLMEHLIEDYNQNEVLIEMLSGSIEKY